MHMSDDQVLDALPAETAATSPVPDVVRAESSHRSVRHGHGDDAAPATPGRELTVPDPARILVRPSHRKREEEPCRTNS